MLQFFLGRVRSTASSSSAESGSSSVFSSSSEASSYSSSSLSSLLSSESSSLSLASSESSSLSVAPSESSSLSLPSSESSSLSVSPSESDSLSSLSSDSAVVTPSSSSLPASLSESSLSCGAFVYDTHGREGIGVVQPNSGTDYPLVTPSEDVRYLLADFYLEYQGDYVRPFHIVYLRGLGCEDTGVPDGIPPHDGPFPHEADVVVVDDEGTIVFDSRDAIYDEDFAPHSGFNARDWGPRLRIYEWHTETAVARLTAHTAWTQSDPDPRHYPFHIVPESAVLDERTLLRLPDRVNSLQVVLNNLARTGVVFTPGYNMKITHTGTVTDPGGRFREQIRFDATPGSGLGIFPGCTSEPLVIRRVNNIRPTDGGDFFLSATDCYYARQPTLIVETDPRRSYPSVLLSPYNTLDLDLPDELAGRTTAAAGWPQSKEYGHLQIGNDCDPCCKCEDYIVLANYINEVGSQYDVLGTEAETIRDIYHTNRDRFLNARDCFHRRPLRIFIQPQICPFVDVALQFCNQTGECAEDITLTVEFSVVPDAVGMEVPGYSFLTGAQKKTGRRTNLTEHSSMAGSWPTYQVQLDSVDNGSSGSAKFRLEFPDCFTPYVLTGTLTGTIKGQPIMVESEDVPDEMVPAEATETRALNCPPNDAGETFDGDRCVE
jgi:hypothetical protein